MGVNRDRVVVVFVHGTFSQPSSLAATIPLYMAALNDELRGEYELVDATFGWSGDNSSLSRRAAARELAEYLEADQDEHSGTRYVLIGHSHGGTVCELAKREAIGMGSRISSVHLIATPLISLSEGRRFATAVRGSLEEGRAGDRFSTVLPLLIIAISAALLASDYASAVFRIGLPTSLGAMPQYFSTASFIPFICFLGLPIVFVLARKAKKHYQEYSQNDDELRSGDLSAAVMGFIVDADSDESRHFVGDGDDEVVSAFRGLRTENIYAIATAASLATIIAIICFGLLFVLHHYWGIWTFEHMGMTGLLLTWILIGPLGILLAAVSFLRSLGVLLYGLRGVRALSLGYMAGPLAPLSEVSSRHERQQPGGGNDSTRRVLGEPAQLLEGLEWTAQGRPSYWTKAVVWFGNAWDRVLNGLLPHRALRQRRHTAIFADEQTVASVARFAAWRLRLR